MAGISCVLGARGLVKRIRVDQRRLEMNVLRSPRSLVLPRPLVPAFLEGSRFVSALKKPPQGILRLGRVGFEGVPITNPTIAAQLRRAIILARRGGGGGGSGAEVLVALKE